MNGIHPKLNGAALASAIVVVLGVLGCRTPSGSLASNPLMGPDRVPPPATRAIQPGEAQPYYPGDPVPSMQGNDVVPEVAPPTGGLAWTAPNANGGAASTVVAANEPVPPMTPPTASSFARVAPATNERAVTIPADEGELRFPPATPVAREPVVPIVNQVVATENKAATPATYYEPVASVPPTAPVWQKPQVSPQQAPALTAPTPSTVAIAPTSTPSPVMSAPLQPSYLLGPPPAYVAQNPVPQTPMDVSLRAVSAASPEPGDYSSPRIRLPGYQPETPLVSANDGFRPRGSMR